MFLQTMDMLIEQTSYWQLHLAAVGGYNVFA